MRVFGVGCYHFGLKTPIEISAENYIIALKDRLNKINTISDINVEFDEDGPDVTIKIDDDVGSFNDSGRSIPLLQFFRLSFSIYIPERIQRDLTKNIYPRCIGVENFKVTIEHDWYGPFTVVECIDSTDETNPSDAVVIIREFFKKEFHEDSGIIRFECLGPSPFHANFVLKESSEELSTPIETKIIKLRGYDHLEFLYRKSEYDDETAYDDVLEELASEFGLYYRLVAEERVRSNEWELLEENVSSVLEYGGGRYI